VLGRAPGAEPARVAYLGQARPTGFVLPMRTVDVVAMGRFPARGLVGRMGDDDRRLVAESMAQMGIADLADEPLGALSGGQRQRVHLAQSLAWRADLLILDEPTSGLDPNQVVEVRELIKDLGREHTVMLSTHILQEVEAVCTRIMIVNLGELVADGTAENLIAELPPGDVMARIKGPEEGIRAQILELTGENHPVEVIARDGDYAVYRVWVGGRKDYLEEGLAHLVVKNGWSLQALWREKPSLEDYFHHKTLKAQQEAGHA
jgi:ABC-type multidrug transport system ATPase subunit